jgi:hypothetical protein
MTVSVCACGKEKIYKIGDTVSTDKAELTMENAEFSELYKAIGIDGKLVTSYGFSEEVMQEINIERNRIFYIVEFEIENISDTVLDDMLRNPDGYPYSNKLSAYVELYYGEDKYVALNDERHDVYDKTARNKYLNIPEDDSHTIYCRFELPREAMDDTDKEIFINIKLPNSEGKAEIFKFRLQ